MRWLPLSASLVVIAIAVAFSYQSAFVASRSGDDAPVYSTRRHDPYGTAALHTLLGERGVPVRTVERSTLEEGDNGVLIQVLRGRPASHRPSHYYINTKQLVDWMTQGNTVIQFTRTPTELMTRLKIVPATQPVAKDVDAAQEAENDGTAPAALPGNVTVARLESADPPVDGTRISLRSPMELAERKDARWTPLARSARSNAVVAASYQVGRGRLVVVGAPTPVLNGFIADEANLDFVLATIGSGPVLFDEWSLGVGHEATVVGFLREVGLMPVLLQVVVIASLYVWSTSGTVPPADPAVTRQRSSTEQIATLGFLYGRSLGPGVTFDRGSAEIQRRIADALRCRPAEIKTRAARLSPELRGKVDGVLDALARINPPHRVRCEGCGYDLTRNESGKCPECGVAIPGHLRRRIADLPAGTEAADPGQARPNLENTLVDLLTRSHQLAQEIERDRNVIR